MCKYCEIDILSNEAKRNIKNNQRVTIKIVRNMLNENLYYLEIDTNSYQKEEISISYCPMCRKEAGRVKSVQEINEEIQKHKEAIKNKIGEKTQDDKIHLWIIQTLEWVIK